MASNLRVDTILPSTGTSLGIGTANGSTTVTGNVSIGGNLGIGGTLTYEDVTNIDSVGVITARSDISIADKIIHTGDTNTAIRFPAADTITAETGGSERTRISSDGHLGTNTDFTGSQLWRAGKRLEIFGGSGNVTGELHLGANRGDGTQSVGSINFFDNTQDSTHRHIALIETDKSGTTSNKRGGTMVFYTKTDNVAAPTEKLRIHATGAVTKPLQPSFGAYGNASWTTINSNSGAVPVLPNVSHNVGSSYNTGNGTFTCPVAGLYQVMFHTLVSTDDDSQNNNTRSFDVFFQIGGSNFARHHVKRGYQNDGDVQVTMDMTCTEIFTINTTVSLYFYANAGNQRWYGAHTYFGVTLLS